VFFHTPPLMTIFMVTVTACGLCVYPVRVLLG